MFLSGHFVFQNWFGLSIRTSMQNLDFFHSKEELMELLRTEVGVVPYSYQGKDGVFEGSQCSKIQDKLEILEPYLQSNNGSFYHNLLKVLVPPPPQMT